MLIAGMLLSGIQLPGNTGVAGAEGLEELPVSAAGASSAIAAGKAAFADMNQHWASPAVDRLAAAGILQGNGQGDLDQAVQSHAQR